MTNFKITDFSEKTPHDDKNKLRSNLKAIGGVESVKMLPATNEVSLAFGMQRPDRKTIATAVSKAGFTMESEA